MHAPVIRVTPDQSFPGRKEREAITLGYEIWRDIGRVKGRTTRMLRTYHLR